MASKYVTDTAAAFRFHFHNARPAFYHAQGYNGRNAWLEKANGIAVECLKRAREDMAAGKTRYFDSYIHRAHKDSNGMIYLGDKPENFGLRLVGRVQADMPRGDTWDKRESSGWYADCYQNETCFGLVYQLPARDGQARFVAAYDFSDRDGGLVFDFSQVFTEDSRPYGYSTSAQDYDAARDAARHADSLAEKAAEEELEYSTAWQAGAQWSDVQGEVRQARQEALAILKERRAARGQEAFPALCKAIRAQVESLLETIQDARDKAAKLASGEYGDLYFWNGDKRLQAAFCEGAEIQSFPS